MLSAMGTSRLRNTAFSHGGPRRPMHQRRLRIGPDGQYAICVDHTREGHFQNATERLRKTITVRQVETFTLQSTFGQERNKSKDQNWRHTRYLRRGPSLPPDGSGQVQNLSRQFFQAAYMHFEARTRAPGDSRRYLAPVGGQKTGSRPIPKGEGVHN